MATPNYSRLKKLYQSYKPLFKWACFILLLFITVSLIISYHIDSFPPERKTFMEELADFMMSIGEAIITTILIGGGLGGVFNFIFEETKKEEEAIKEKFKKRQDDREKNKLFRWEMLGKLQEVNDNVELARILIKSHKSGKTYGEQIHNRIMPSLISLQDFKRRLSHAEDRALVKNMEYLQVSLTYMVAYLSALIEEFECSYLEISNLQTYQDALANRMRALFTEITEGKKEDIISLEKKKKFLQSAEELFGNIDVPSKMEVVWQAMEKLDYIWDFIADLRNEKGAKSLYYKHFLLHYFHCIKILKTQNSETNKRLTAHKKFQENLQELQRVEEKKKSDVPLTTKDSLTRKIMIEELLFDFDTAKMKI